jgi:hypothetical protein
VKDLKWWQGVVMLVGAFLMSLGGCGWFFLRFEGQGAALGAILFVAGLGFFVAGIIRSLRAGVKPLPIVAGATMLVGAVVSGIAAPLAESTVVPPQIVAVAGIALILASFWRRTGK